MTKWSNKKLTDKRRHELLANEVSKIRNSIKQLKNFEALMLEKMKQYDHQQTAHCEFLCIPKTSILKPEYTPGFKIDTQTRLGGMAPFPLLLSMTRVVF